MALSGAAKPERARILVVDDDPAMAGLLERVLRSEGHEVRVVGSAHEARVAVVESLPDVMLLDVVLADADGLDVLTDIRRDSDVPIILVSGRGEESDRVLGLRLGADDYIVKPFSSTELGARVDAVLRRTKRRAGQAVQVFGPLSIDSAARQVRLDGRLIETTPKEFDLLSFLANSPRQVFSRNQLLHDVWSSSASWQDQATVTEHVRRLRTKLDDNPDTPRWIQTVRGIGYRFEP